ncbi:MAG: chorismate-binding protein [Rhodoluna sp.]
MSHGLGVLFRLSTHSWEQLIKLSALNLTAAEVDELAKTRKIIPIVISIPLNGLNPLNIYSELAGGRSGTFLLESAQQGVWSRYSFVGIRSRGTITMSKEHSIQWHSEANKSPLPGANQTLPNDPFAALSTIQSAWNTEPISNLPMLTSGLVGVLSWDLIRSIEKLPKAPVKDFPVPTVAMSMIEDLAIIDHKLQQLLLVSNIYVDDELIIDEAYATALRKLETMERNLTAIETTPLRAFNTSSELEYVPRTEKQAFLDSVFKAKEYVRKGDVFQVVVSQRFDATCEAEAINVYRALRQINPSPYMYLLHFEDSDGPFAVVGSSPEALVTVVGEDAVTHPIAGSRPRGVTDSEDENRANELIADTKEKAEHLMLVDLARNDLSKVCQPATVEVTEFMEIHRFSHIMHLVSTVSGKLRSGVTPVDVFKATFPAGTLSGAPKPRALEIIEEVETSNRGIFGGVVGYFDFSGNADLAIAIRTALIRGNVAHVQAGAGIVLDSDPESEYLETISKASAPLRAISMANSVRK